MRENLLEKQTNKQTNEKSGKRKTAKHYCMIKVKIDVYYKHETKNVKTKFPE